MQEGFSPLFPPPGHDDHWTLTTSTQSMGEICDNDGTSLDVKLCGGFLSLCLLEMIQRWGTLCSGQNHLVVEFPLVVSYTNKRLQKGTLLKYLWNMFL